MVHTINYTRAQKAVVVFRSNTGRSSVVSSFMDWMALGNIMVPRCITGKFSLCFTQSYCSTMMSLVLLIMVALVHTIAITLTAHPCPSVPSVKRSKHRVAKQMAQPTRSIQVNKKNSSN